MSTPTWIKHYVSQWNKDHSCTSIMHSTVEFIPIIASLETELTAANARIEKLEADGRILDAAEGALKSQPEGRTLFKINGFDLTYYGKEYGGDIGFHVALNDAADPIICECDLRSAITAAITQQEKS